MPFLYCTRNAWRWIVYMEAICTRTCCDCIALIRRCVTSMTPATSIVAVMTSNSISCAIRMSPSGLSGRHLLVFDQRRFIYLYIFYAEYGAAATAADGKCAWICQRDLRKRWRIVGGLMRCVYTLTAWLFSDAHSPSYIHRVTSVESAYDVVMEMLHSSAKVLLTKVKSKNKR